MLPQQSSPGITEAPSLFLAPIMPALLFHGFYLDHACGASPVGKLSLPYLSSILRDKGHLLCVSKGLILSGCLARPLW